MTDRNCVRGRSTGSGSLSCKCCTEDVAERGLFLKLKEALEAERPLRELALEADETKRLRNDSFLSEKPVLLMVNFGEADIRDAAKALGGSGLAGLLTPRFVVNPDVLVARPETELIVERALVRLRRLERPVLVDVGTGCGCIALSLAAEPPDAEVHATELSAAALDVARVNARRLSLEARVAFHEGDRLLPVQGLRFDAIVSNPSLRGTRGACLSAARGPRPRTGARAVPPPRRRG